MNLTTIAEHTLCLDLLPERANVLDLGALGMLFSNEMARLGHNVHAVDIQDVKIDKSVTDKNWIHVHKLAISNFNGAATIIKSNDPQAMRIEQKRKLGAGPDDVRCVTLSNFSKSCSIKFWDVIKLDVEGSEYEIIMSLNQPPAKQLSIEFHLHTGIYGIRQMAEMHDKLKELGYTAAQHEMTKQHGLGLNFWDSLFVLQ